MNDAQMRVLLKDVQRGNKNNAALREEITGTLAGNDITRDWVHPDDQLMPKDNLMTDLHLYYDDYKEVLRDLRVKVGISQRLNALLGSELIVETGLRRGMNPTKADKQAADSLRYNLMNLQADADNADYANVVSNIGFDGASSLMWYGFYYGLSVAELIYAPDNREVILERVAVRDRTRFIVDGANRLRMRHNAFANGVLLPSRKFWAFSTGADNGDEPYGLGLAHWLYWYVNFRKENLKHLLKSVEKYADPTVLLEYDPHLDFPSEDAQEQASREQQKKILQNVADNIQSRSGALIPKGIVIKLLEADRKASSDGGGYPLLYKILSDEIAQLLVGNTSSINETAGKLGQDKQKENVQADYTRADANGICTTFQAQAAKWLTQWNYPTAATPRVYRQVKAEEDLEQRAKRDQIIFSFSNLKPSKQYIEKTYGDAYALCEEKQEVSFNVEKQNFAEAEHKPSEYENLLTMAAELFGDELDKMFDTIARALANATTFEDVENALKATIDAYDDEKLKQILTGLNVASSLQGVQDVNDGN